MLNRKYLSLIGKLSVYVYIIFKNIIDAKKAFKYALLFQIFFSSPSSSLKSLYNKKTNIAFIKEFDRRFDRIYSAKICGGSNFWIIKNLLDFLTKEIFGNWFNSYLSGQNPRYINPLHRYYHSENKENCKSYYEYCQVVVDTLNIFNIKVLVIASADDSINIELINACNFGNIKVVLCEREGTHTIRSSDSLKKLYLDTNKLTIDYIYTANDLHYQCYRGSSHSNTVVKIIGELRSDFWREKDFEYKHYFYKDLRKYKKLVVFLAFGERNYIEPMYHPHVKGNWHQLRNDVEDVLVTFLENNPDVLLVYKMGHVEDFHLKSIEKFNKFKNFKIFDRGFDCSELLSKADLAIGFQSTATIEALYYDCEVIYPFWAIPNEIDINRDILPLHKDDDVFMIASSPIQLMKILTDSLEKKLNINQYYRDNRNKIIERYFNNSNKKIYKLLKNELKEIISQ